LVVIASRRKVNIENRVLFPVPLAPTMTQKRGMSFMVTSRKARKFLSRIDSICMIQHSRFITFSDSISRQSLPGAFRAIA